MQHQRVRVVAGEAGHASEPGLTCSVVREVGTRVTRLNNFLPTDGEHVGGPINSRRQEGGGVVTTRHM